MHHKMDHLCMPDMYNSTEIEVDLALADYNIPTKGYEPDTLLMSQFDQIIIRRLLSHHTAYVSAGCSMTNKRGEWIYALLARLEKPLHRDEASVLTELLRGLCRARAAVAVGLQEGDSGGNSNGDEDVLKVMNVLILLIGVYFEQCTDLDRLMMVVANKNNGSIGMKE